MTREKYRNNLEIDENLFGKDNLTSVVSEPEEKKNHNQRIKQ